MESPENANVASKAADSSPAPSVGRWQFTIAGMLTLTTVCAAVLSIASVIGWELSGRIVIAVAALPLFLMCVAGPTLAWLAWLVLRRRAPRWRILLPVSALFMVLASGAVLAAVPSVSRIGETILTSTVLLWIPQVFLWVAEAQRLERAEARAAADLDPLSPPAESKTMEGSRIPLPGRERSP